MGTYQGDAWEVAARRVAVYPVGIYPSFRLGFLIPRHAGMLTNHLESSRGSKKWIIH